VNQTPGSDLDLVARARAGELEAFEELVKRHQRPLFGFLYRMCGDSNTAEELAQAAMVRSWEKLATFRGESGFKTWLFRIGANLCINRRTRTKPTEELPETLAAPSVQEPPEVYQQRVRERLVQAALSRLPDDQRTALVLSLYEHMSYKEIGTTMGKSARAVDSLLFRAKTNVRKSLADAREKGMI
jgi:RNA polymerase sigma-70 factor (ECF subfamily)